MILMEPGRFSAAGTASDSFGRTVHRGRRPVFLPTELRVFALGSPVRVEAEVGVLGEADSGRNSRSQSVEEAGAIALGWDTVAGEKKKKELDK